MQGGFRNALDQKKRRRGWLCKYVVGNKVIAEPRVSRSGDGDLKMNRNSMKKIVLSALMMGAASVVMSSAA